MTTNSSGEHHHRSSLKQVNKSFKGTTAAKRAELRGKLFKNAAVKTSNSSSVKQLKGLSKKDRLNKAHLQMGAKREALLQDTRIYAGPNGLPRVLTFIPLNRTENACTFSNLLMGGSGVFYDEKQKRRFQVLPPVNITDHLELIDRVTQADTVVFVVDCTSSNSNDIVDESGLMALSLIRANGFSSAIIVILESERMALKKRRELHEECKSFFKVELPNVESFFVFDADNLGAKRDLFIFNLTNINMRGISWRDLRPYMIIEECGQVMSEDGKSTRTVLTGLIRGGSMNADQTVCIPGVDGSLTMNNVTLITCSANGNRLGMECDNVTAVPMRCERVGVANMATHLCRHEAMDVTTLADTEMSNDASSERKSILAPKGTSSYQAAWIAEDEEDEDGSCSEDDCEMSGDDVSEEVEEVCVEERKSVHFAESDFDMNEDEEEMEEEGDEKREALLSHRQKKIFPDEIELDEDGSARERLSKYRAVKSLRTSEWDIKEGLPQEYSQICAFQNYKLSRKRALQLPDSPFCTGSRVSVVLNTSIVSHNSLIGKTAFFMLPHEHQTTVLNMTVKRVSNDRIYSKERMLLVAGPRRLWVNPIFSEHTNNHQLHKMLRELPEDGIAVASCFAPVTFDPCPVLLFRQGHSGYLELILSGSILSNDPNRINLKRVTLTGTPFKIHKRVVVVRFMFFNPADINYFKPVELMTRMHRRGHIKESLGTHGYMKCMFDKQIQHHDTVFMHLFKRIFPKWTTEEHQY